ncbi:Cell cycle checkpoint protein rad17 [Podochytrium sp. JEL0797]|nr:Cell cycle checkpoint protein rad17 [Podochytrium sp. JEL0797]
MKSKEPLNTTKRTNSAISKPPKKPKSTPLKRKESKVIVISDDEDDILDDDFDTPSNSQPPLSQWIFGGSQSSKQAVPIPKCNHTDSPNPFNQQAKLKSDQETQLWVDKHTPYLASDLAVHTKKIQDVHTWFLDALDPSSATLRRLHKSHRILALTGISGSAKTAVVRVLAMEMDIEVVEWVNPVNEFGFDSANHSEADSREYMSGSTSAIQKFSEFIASARKTNALSFSSTGPDDSSLFQQHKSRESPKIILIEDLPNLSNPQTRASFHSIIQTHAFCSSKVHPIVLILSDTVATASGGGDWKSRSYESVMNLRNVVPENVRMSPAFTRIQFNPIAASFLVKALTRVVTEEFRTLPQQQKPTKSQIEDIASSSGGDIRCALNTLQFMTLFDDTRGDGGGKISQRMAKQQMAKQDVGNRDVSLIFYHALSKILVGKRLEPNERPDAFPGLQEYQSAQPLRPPTDASLLPDHLKHHQRKPLKSNPEHVFESSHTDADGFVSYLAENYTSMFTEIEECVSAIDSYCEADSLLGPWTNRGAMSSYAASIACRGTMFARTHALPKQKFGSLQKPQAISAFVAKRDTTRSVEEAWRRWTGNWNRSLGVGAQFQVSNNYTHSALTTDVIPFAGSIVSFKPSSHCIILPQDKALIQRMCAFSLGSKNGGSGGAMRKLDLLDELDVGNDDDDEDVESQSLNMVDVMGHQQMQILEEEIEDIED